MTKAVATTENTASALITPAAMIQQAIQQGSGVEVMERLLALQERHDAFQARKAFDDAMADMRSDMPTIIKGQSADFGKGKTAYKFEDLSAVTEALSPIMAKVGLSFRWRTQSQQNGVSVTCIISHREGHSEETTLFAGLDTSGSKNAIQALGSAVTYLQRYTLKAAVGVAAAKDDDAQEVGRRDDPPQRQQQARQPDDFPFDNAPPAKTYQDFLTAITNAADMAALKPIFAEAWRSALPANDKTDLQQAYNARKNQIEPPIPDDDVPFTDYVEPSFDGLDSSK